MRTSSKNPTTKKYQYFKMEITAIQNGDIMQMAELIPAYKACDHQWAVDHTTDATCTEGSYKIEKCSVCGIEKKTLLEPAKGHQLDENGKCTNCGEEGIEVNETNFPDKNFRNYILEQEYGNDGLLTPSEISAVTSIDVYNKDISDLKGIEYFTSLTYLKCSSNQLTSLDVSKNTELTDFQCSSNNLTELDVSNNTELTNLDCGSNQLTSLDVSNNTELTKLYCSSNKLTSLDVSKNTALTEFYCGNNNLTELDVSKNTALEELGCSSNKLTKLDVSKNTALTKRLYCYNNPLLSLKGVSRSVYLNADSLNS